MYVSYLKYHKYLFILYPFHTEYHRGASERQKKNTQLGHIQKKAFADFVGLLFKFLWLNI